MIHCRFEELFYHLVFMMFIGAIVACLPACDQHSERQGKELPTSELDTPTVMTERIFFPANEEEESNRSPRYDHQVFGDARSASDRVYIVNQQVGESIVFVACTVVDSSHYFSRDREYYRDRLDTQFGDLKQLVTYIENLPDRAGVYIASPEKASSIWAEYTAVSPDDYTKIVAAIETR